MRVQNRLQVLKSIVHKKKNSVVMFLPSVHSKSVYDSFVEHKRTSFENVWMCPFIHERLGVSAVCLTSVLQNVVFGVLQKEKSCKFGMT